MGHTRTHCLVTLYAYKTVPFVMFGQFAVQVHVTFSL